MPPGLEARGVLGSGAMGRVYKAWQPRLQRYVAVKTCDLSGAEEKDIDPVRLEDEALVIARLSHPNIVTLFDVYRDDRAVYLIMECLDGAPLSRLIGKKTPLEKLGRLAELVEQAPEGRRRLSERWVCEVAIAVGRALDYAHTQGILHRDIKPANIHLTDRRHIKLLDFSIARFAERKSTKTATGMIFGTMDYISPEQILTEPLDGRADIYSLGATLYHLATGQPPFMDENDIQLCMKHVNNMPQDPREINPDLSDQVAETILCCLSKHPGDRFGSAGELAEAMQDALAALRAGASGLQMPDARGEPVSSADVPIPDSGSGMRPISGDEPSSSPFMDEDDLEEYAEPEERGSGPSRSSVILDPVFLGSAPEEPSRQPVSGPRARGPVENVKRGEEQQLRAKRPEERRLPEKHEDSSTRAIKRTKRKVGLEELAAKNSTQVPMMGPQGAGSPPRAVTPNSLPPLAGPASPPTSNIGLGGPSTPLPLGPVASDPPSATTWDEISGGGYQAPAPSRPVAQPKVQKEWKPIVIFVLLVVGALSAVLGFNRCSGGGAGSSNRVSQDPVPTPVSGNQGVREPAGIDDTNLIGEEPNYVTEGPDLPVPPPPEVLPGFQNTQRVALGNGQELEFVEIPAGRFVIGSPRTEPGRDSDEGPRTIVEIQDPFLMSRTEVTRGQWQAIMGEESPGPSSGIVVRDSESQRRSTGSVSEADNLPMTRVTWAEAAEFCSRLSLLATQRAGRTINFKLPTEAQWEYACRAGSDTPFAYGRIITSDLANIDGTEPYPRAPASPDRGFVTPAGSLPPNAWGLYDMHGNVWELVRDRYSEDYPGGHVRDWVGGRRGYDRVMRGGSYSTGAEEARSANRAPISSTERRVDLGFRIIMEPN